MKPLDKTTVAFPKSWLFDGFKNDDAIALAEGDVELVENVEASEQIEVGKPNGSGHSASGIEDGRNGCRHFFGLRNREHEREIRYALVARDTVHFLVGIANCDNFLPIDRDVATGVFAADFVEMRFEPAVVALQLGGINHVGVHAEQFTVIRTAIQEWMCRAQTMTHVIPSRFLLVLILVLAFLF